MKGNAQRSRSDSDDREFWSVALEFLSRGNDVRFRPPGNSMAPFIRPDETVTVIPCLPGDVKFGDIILYSTGSDPVASPKRLHRLLKRDIVRGKWLLFTKGDSLPFLDDPILPEQVLGRVSAIVKGRWTIDLNRTWGKAVNFAWALLQISPLSRWLICLGWRGMKAVVGRLVCLVSLIC